MTDDPRDILKAAGAECAEVDAFYGPHSYGDEVDISVCFDEADAAITVLARLVAKFKYERDLCSVDLCVVLGEPALNDADDPRVGMSPAVIADLDRRWEEHCK